MRHTSWWGGGGPKPLLVNGGPLPLVGREPSVPQPLLGRDAPGLGVAGARVEVAGHDHRSAGRQRGDTVRDQAGGLVLAGPLAQGQVGC